MAARSSFMSSPDSSPKPPTPASPSNHNLIPSAPRILDALLHERATIEPLRLALPNLCSLLEAEIARLSTSSSNPNPTTPLTPVSAAFIRPPHTPNPLTRRPSAPILSRRRVKIPVPADKYPEYNFVGRLLGPRGTTLKTLERDTACKIMIRGKGSIRKDKEPAIRGKPGWEHVFNEPLHVVIEVDDSRLDDTSASRALNRAKEAVELLLVPVPEERDALKRQQLRALAIMNGTYRGAPSRSHDQLPISSYATSPSIHPMSQYPPTDPSSPPLYLAGGAASPLSSTIFPHMNQSMDESAPLHHTVHSQASEPVPFTNNVNRHTGRRSPSSGATSPNTYEASIDQLSALTSKMQQCAVDEFASSSVGDDSPESSHSSEEGEPSTHIIGNGYRPQQVKVSPISPIPGQDTSLSFGGFIGQEFYNGAFSNGGTFPSPWNNLSTTNNQAPAHMAPLTSPFASNPYSFTTVPAPQVLTTSSTTVTPTDQQGGY